MSEPTPQRSYNPAEIRKERQSFQDLRTPSVVLWRRLNNDSEEINEETGSVETLIPAGGRTPETLELSDIELGEDDKVLVFHARTGKWVELKGGGEEKIYAVVMTAVQRPAEPFDTSLIPGRIAIIGKEYESADDYEKCICTELAENLYTGETTIAEQIPVGRTIEVVQANADYYAAVNLYEFVECYVPDTICGGNHGTGLQESPDGTAVPGSYNVTFFTSLLPIDYKIAPGGVLLQRVSNRLEVVGTACGNIVEPLPPDAEPGVYRLGVPVLIQCNNSGLCVFEHSIEQGVPVKDDDGNILYYEYFDTGYRVQVDASNLGGQPTVGVTWTDPEGVEHTETQTYACVCPEPTPTPSPSPTPTPSPTPPPDAMCGNIPYNSTTHKCCTVIIGGDQAYAVVVPIGQDCPDNPTPTPTPSPTPTPTPSPTPSPTPTPNPSPSPTPNPSPSPTPNNPTPTPTFNAYQNIVRDVEII